jgi:hypothetical protein
VQGYRIGKPRRKSGKVHQWRLRYRAARPNPLRSPQILPHGPQPDPRRRNPSCRRCAPAAARGPPSRCDALRRGRGGPEEAWIRGGPPIGSRAGANRGAPPHRRRFRKGLKVVRSSTAASGGEQHVWRCRALASHAPPPTRGGLTLKLTSE